MVDKVYETDALALKALLEDRFGPLTPVAHVSATMSREFILLCKDDGNLLVVNNNKIYVLDVEQHNIACLLTILLGDEPDHVKHHKLH